VTRTKRILKSHGAGDTPERGSKKKDVLEDPRYAWE